MARLIPKTFLDDAKKYQRQHVEDMSRDITIVTGEQLTEECPNCYYDTVAGTSSASYTGLAGTITLFSGTAYEQVFEAKNFRQICPVCKGVGSFSIPLTVTIKAHISWEDSASQQSTLVTSSPGIEGQSRVKIKSHSADYNYYLNAEYFIIDGIELLPDTVPIVRGIGQKDGIVELWCKTRQSGDKRIRT